jgi:hypothetical protein
MKMSVEPSSCEEKNLVAHGKRIGRRNKKHGQKSGYVEPQHGALAD